MSNENLRIMLTNRIFMSIAIVALSATMAITASAQDIIPTKSDYKLAKAQAKADAKEGWKVDPGSLPLKEQYAISYYVQRNQSEWFYEDGTASGDIKSVTRSNAVFNAKVKLTERIVEALWGKEKAAGTEDSSSEQGSIQSTTYKEEAKAKFTNVLRNPRIIIDCYRDTGGGNMEFKIRVAMPMEEAKTSIEKIRRELEGLHETW